MKRKVLTVTAAAFVGLSGVWLSSGNIAYANGDIDKKISDLNEKSSNVNKNINEGKEEIKSLQEQQKKTEAEMKRLDEKIGETNEKIRNRESEISETKKEIEKLKKDIEEVKERIEKRNELLKDRAVALQESGGSVDYMQVLLGSQSFGDFISRVSAVSTIVEADRELLIQHEQDKKELQTKETAVQTKLESLEKALKDLETLSADLEKQVDEKDKLIATLQSQEQSVNDEIVGLEEEAALLADQKKAAEGEKAAWEQEQREKAKAAAEAKARAEAEAKASQSQPAAKSAPSAAPAQKAEAAPAPAVTSGSFMRPANGPVTSRYGYREKFGRMHYGIDIGKRGSSVPIVSVADGTVIRAYYSSSFGNVVFVRHNVNGQTWVSVYAHLESYNVSSGQSIGKGQQLGYMGNTGRSFGAHLHFELHKGDWQGSSSAVNPENYINF
ncbi:peptidase M23 [Bacillus sp. VT 712]|uniref:Peptidase M23 n=1 Tax=Priestia veravalensis TaxID=1414648 RepID=A0A0V8JL40_9BACI|nr:MULTISPECIES: peptidoglycan DD-metalloendopeptidase family protein [Bacillaceae]KSU87672.1 peptidase M23 [Priestia veravalensis]KZB91643.1 peptidase M23 [Bacillus sp. VT 712]MEC0665079.1 peptidoglycan DD-metalloendopeptidase family protein [Priestia flexa]MED3822362.1 peptidoglycan DD-metalloendopeptidase family protein [Priestia flexa]WHX78927.1 peptidoglycan DD-metalloendopeptidase family protein [Priestia flexa]